MKRLRKNERGFAAIVAMILVGMLTLIGLAALSTSDDELSIAGNELKETRAFYAAEAGLEIVAARLHNLSDSNLTLITDLPFGKEEIQDCYFVFETVDKGPAEQKVINNGTLAGMQSLVKTYTMTSTGYHQGSNSKVEISQNFELALIPIVQYGVFYNNDLEISPGADMTMLGRVHTNGDLYLQASTKLEMDSYVTAAGSIIHGRKGPGVEENGDILIKDGTGNLVSMKDGTDFLHSKSPYWYDSSVARWNGRVQDNTHGQSSLNFPITDASKDPHKMIERETGNPDSYEAKASLKFINGKAYQLVGTVWSDVTADMKAKGIITETSNKFYDAREGQWVDVMDLDVRLMYDNNYAPSNGIMYYAQNGGGYSALRINNASTLDTGLTIASERPVYTKGDFNKDTKQPAAIIADAVTVLSDAFNDLDSDKDKSLRVANSTIVNASIITGNTETTSTTYNGGFENTLRLLESWAHKSLTWSGSMANLWNSVYADGSFSTSYFDEPKRDWAYDSMLDNPAFHPPGAPTIRVIFRTGWDMEDVSHGLDDFSNVATETTVPIN